MLNIIGIRAAEITVLKHNFGMAKMCPFGFPKLGNKKLLYSQPSSSYGVLLWHIGKIAV